MTPDNGNPFWSYSLTLYVREGVAAACLDLQDRLDLDVNLLLFCCWAGSRGRTLNADETAELIAATRDWRDKVILPLRGARRWLKDQTLETGEAAANLREDIKARELAAESIQQDILNRVRPVPEGAASPAAMAANLKAYLGAEGARPGAADMDALSALLHAAASELSPGAARRLLDG